MQNWFVQALETGKTNEPLERFSVWFHSECKWILYISTMYVHCIYSTMSKTPKQLPNCLEQKQALFYLIFDGVLSVKSTLILLPFLSVTTWIRYQKSYILVSDRIYQNLSSQFNLAAQTEPVQDKIVHLVTKQLKNLKNLILTNTCSSHLDIIWHDSDRKFTQGSFQQIWF